jgi:LmbE family N-acetylglucosaminyl deacetylase
MGKSAAKLTCVLFLAFLVTPLQAEEGFLTGTPAIRYSLAKVNVLGSVLMIGAHPDDENNAVLAYVSRGLKARTGYLSLNRGEGGQNLLGLEQGALLGVLRTQELLAARRDDGAQQFFTRAIDFGFTPSLEETLTDWGRDKILSDIVWIIRQQQPDVIILCFSGTSADGHGNHQAAGVLGKEAYEAAGDPSRFPDQLKWVKPWRARRLLRSRFTPPPPPPGEVATGEQGANGAGRGGTGRGGAGRGAASAAPGPGRAPDPFPNQPTFVLDPGEFDPVIGRSYREISVISRSEHRSQGQGATLIYGNSPSTLAFVEGEQPKKDVLDGIDVSWNRVPGGARIGEIISKAAREFEDAHPEKIVPALLEARKLITVLASDGQAWGKWKLEEIDELIALCAGIRAEAAADSPTYVPGAIAKVNLTALNRSPLPITLADIHLSGWGDVDAPVRNKTLGYNKTETTLLSLPVPARQPWSQPFWLREPHNEFTYTISDQTLIGRADILPEVVARFDFNLNSNAFSVTRPIHYRYADPATGELIRPVAVQPPIAVELPAENLVFPLGASRDISLHVRALGANQAGSLRFEAPQGWKVQPASAAFSLKEAGEDEEVRFHITPPQSAIAGKFKAVAKANGVEVATGVDLIPYAHIPAQSVLLPSEGRLTAVQVKTLARRIGYVMGSTDQEPEALRQIAIQVDVLNDNELMSGNLAVYDAIVTGLRAWAVRADLRASQQRLFEYVRNGGTLIVQYNRNTDRRMSPSVSEALDHLGPWPFTIGDNEARVTQENAPVKFLQPDSPLLNIPNKITQADFDGWVQERGLYFATKWDERYQTPLESHDKGDKEQRGGILYTRLGKGAYIFTAYAWNRELPGGVPGAYRIFANLISAGKAAPQK